MPKIQQRDFYFGAGLSMFFKHNKDSRPTLLESVDKKSKLFSMTTDTSEEFYVYMKYTEKEQPSKGENSHKWHFPLTSTEKNILDECINSKLKVYIILICGSAPLKTGEIAILSQKEYEKIKNKTSITVKLPKNGKKFTIPDSGGPIRIDTNRIEMKLTEID